jgi:DNA (cytosine-5)-methyltransferase 1
MKLKILDLFSGIGGFSLGLEATGHFETAAFCEIDPYCKQVLKKHWPNVPIFDDIRQLKGTDIGTIDIITGGYPCQPFSVAGKQKAEQDPRHLWPEYFRLIQELKPTWVIGENVSGHIKLGLDSVLEDLASEGYSTRTFSISASSIGANHKRERIWTVAYSNDSRDRTSQHEANSNWEKINEGWQEQSFSEPSRQSENVANTDCRLRGGRRTIGSSRDDSKRKLHPTQKEQATHDIRSKTIRCNTVRGKTETMADSDSERLKEQWRSKSISTKGDKSECGSSEEGIGWWKTEPRVGRVAHGIPKRVDRLKSLGNAVVPHIPYLIGQAIVESYQ